MHCTVHCLRVNPMFYHFPTYLLLSSIVFLSMLCWTSCSHNFVLLVVLYIVVVPPCYAFEPSVMCGNHQKVDNTEAAERLALVEPQLSPEKVVSLFDKFHTHTQLSPVTFLFFQCQSSKNKNCFCCPKAMPPLLRT
jgi:hypothetical protein